VWRHRSRSRSNVRPRSRIDYTALSFVAPEKVRFRYRLEGQDRDWREVVNDREVQYSNLAPRHYRFRVTACNNSGVWNEAGTFMDFSIDPAYNQTAWFQAVCATAFLALLWALYRLRLHQIAREFNARLEARVDERTRIARELPKHRVVAEEAQRLPEARLRRPARCSMTTSSRISSTTSCPTPSRITASRRIVRTARIAGLSMGGGQTLYISIPHLDKFAYIGVYSSGLFGIPGGAPAAAVRLRRLPRRIPTQSRFGRNRIKPPWITPP
jgi:hypothetical protein